jgi:outer membrane beta-barrel protein
MLSVMYGPGISNAYRSSTALSGRVAYYFSEWLGVEGFYSGQFNKENDTYEALKSTNTQIAPVVREVRSQLGFMLQYVPWYAKINFFNSILYFDWYLSGGVGTSRTALDTRATSGQTLSSPVSYTESTLTTYYLGTGQIFHVNDWLSVRLEFQASLYRAPINGTTGKDIWYSNDVFGFGLGVKL